MYGNAEEYQQLLVYLLEGLKKCKSRVVSGTKVNGTLLGRLRRVLEHMSNYDVYFSVENIFDLFKVLLFVHDYQTSVFVVRLLQQGKPNRSTHLCSTTYTSSK